MTIKKKERIGNTMGWSNLAFDKTAADRYKNLYT